MSEETLAHRVFAAIYELQNLDNEMNDALLSAAGADPDAPDTWPCDDIWCDPYDSSFEFGGVRPGWKPSPECLAAWSRLGFHQFWLNYSDESELYGCLDPVSLGKLRESSRPRGQKHDALVARLYARVDELEGEVQRLCLSLTHEGPDLTKRVLDRAIAARGKPLLPAPAPGRDLAAGGK